MRTEQITVEDFDNAVKQPWSSRTCLVAQALIRLGLTNDELKYDPSLACMGEFGPIAETLQSKFDLAFDLSLGNRKEPDHAALVAIRASLPQPLELSE